MVNLTIDPAVGVTQACVRRRFRFLPAALAPMFVSGAGVFTGAGAGQHRYTTRCCTACGDAMLFVCPVDAITGIKPH